MNFTDAFLMTIDSDRVHHGHCWQSAKQMAAFDADDFEQCRNGIWTVEQARHFTLADNLKDYFELAIDDVADHFVDESQSCLMSCLVRAGFDEIDWREVAEHYLTKVSENN